MDESVDSVDQPSGEISRRQMIIASVAAGGLAWSAPLLLSGRAAADPADTCCTDGTKVTVKVSSLSGADCNGTSCIDMRASAFPAQFSSFAMTCSTFVGCINSTTLKLFTVTAFDGNAGTATIYVKQGITVISVGAQDTSDCYFADCPCFATQHGAVTNPNECGNTQLVKNGNTFQLVQTGQGYITVNTGVVIGPGGTPNPPGEGTYSVIDIAVPKNLNTIQITLCLSHQVTGMCH